MKEYYLKIPVVIETNYKLWDYECLISGLLCDTINYEGI